MFLTIKINNYDEAMSEQELTLETARGSNYAI